MNKTYLEGVAGIAMGFIGSMVGGFDVALVALLQFMVVDIISGICGVLMKGNSKYGEGISSRGLTIGAIRKGAEFLVIVMAVQLDKVLGSDTVRTGVVYYLLATEGISIVENLGRCGVPLPSFLIKILDVMKTESDGGNNES